MTRPITHCAPVRRSAEMIHSDGRLSFVRSSVHDSSAAIRVLPSSFRLPSLSVKLFVNLSTSDLTKAAEAWQGAFLPDRRCERRRRGRGCGGWTAGGARADARGSTAYRAEAVCAPQGAGSRTE